jgi:KDO2-lipid IV(A) lauroyltransferase
MFQRILSSRPVTGLGMFLARRVPPLVGHAIAYTISGLINWLKPSVYWTAYANLRQVVGSAADERTVHRMVRQVFRNTARNNYQLWHLVGREQEVLEAAVHIPPDVWDRIDQARQRGKGVIIVGIHTGNFDVALLALATQRRDTQVLGIAAPPGGGFDLMDHMRTSKGVHLTSIGVSALREAIERLRAGGIILTGVDRPVNDEGYWVEFFGRPSPLPTGHVRLALKTDAVVLVASAHRDMRGVNVIRTSPALEMVRVGGLDEDLQINMRRVTAWLERFIRIRPEQWGMFVPVWPERRG